MRHNKFDGKTKRLITCIKLGINKNDLDKQIIDWYTTNRMSGQEIADLIYDSTGIKWTARSIQRVVARYGKTRTVKNSFNNAIKRGRVKWAYKDKKFKRKRLSNKLRLAILKRDNFKCVLCGATSEYDLLEVDHIVPLCRGGLTIDSNLRVLCYSCNKGKQSLDKEK